MPLPNYAYPPDPHSNDPNWKEITTECSSLVKGLFSDAVKRFGPPTKNGMPVRITEFSHGPHISFIKGIAYIGLDLVSDLALQNSSNIKLLLKSCMRCPHR